MNKYSLGFVIVNIGLFAIHLVLGFLGLINIVEVILAPGCITLTSVFIHFLFAYCISRNDFSILAGYNEKKDDTAQVKKQLNAIGLLSSVFALFFNVIFFAAYAFPNDGQGILSIILSAILLGAYIITVVIIVIGVNVKIKTR